MFLWFIDHVWSILPKPDTPESYRPDHLRKRIFPLSLLAGKAGVDDFRVYYEVHFLCCLFAVSLESSIRQDSLCATYVPEVLRPPTPPTKSAVPQTSSLSAKQPASAVRRASIQYSMFLQKYIRNMQVKIDPFWATSNCVPCR